MTFSFGHIEAHLCFPSLRRIAFLSLRTWRWIWVLQRQVATVHDWFPRCASTSKSTSSWKVVVKGGATWFFCQLSLALGESWVISASSEGLEECVWQCSRRLDELRHLTEVSPRATAYPDGIWAQKNRLQTSAPFFPSCCRSATEGNMHISHLSNHSSFHFNADVKDEKWEGTYCYFRLFLVEQHNW